MSPFGDSYDDNSLKTGLGVAWLGNFTAITARGESFFETLMLNFVMLDHEGAVWDIGPASWEKRWTPIADVRAVAMPRDPVAILSAHSRYGRFVKENGKLTKYESEKGGICFESVTKNEQMALWRYNKKKNTHDVQRSFNNQQMWREFRTIIAEKELHSGLVTWNFTLINDDRISRDTMLNYEIVN